MDSGQYPSRFGKHSQSKATLQRFAAAMLHLCAPNCLRCRGIVGHIWIGCIHDAQIPSQSHCWWRSAHLAHVHLRLARPGFRRVASYTANRQSSDSHRRGDRPPYGLWHRVRRLVVASQAFQPTAACFGQHSAVVDGLSPIRILSVLRSPTLA